MTDFGWSLPPGVRESDIPGNRPQDIARDAMWEKVTDCIPAEFDDFAMTIEKIKLGVEGGDISLEDFQKACIEMVNFCDTYDLDLGSIGNAIHDAGVWSPIDEGPEYDPEREFDD